MVRGTAYNIEYLASCLRNYAPIRIRQISQTPGTLGEILTSIQNIKKSKSLFEGTYKNEFNTKF